MKKKQQEMKAHERRAELVIGKLTAADKGGRLTAEERAAAIGRVLTELQGKQQAAKRQGKSQAPKMGF